MCRRLDVSSSGFYRRWGKREATVAATVPTRLRRDRQLATLIRAIHAASKGLSWLYYWSAAKLCRSCGHPIVVVQPAQHRPRLHVGHRRCNHATDRNWDALLDSLVGSRRVEVVEGVLAQYPK